MVVVSVRVGNSFGSRVTAHGGAGAITQSHGERDGIHA
jgi:hypothetical protein